MDKPIQTIGADDFPVCPACGQRTQTFMARVSGQWMPTTVGSDEAGPIFLASCKQHGTHRFQVEELKGSQEAA